MSFSTDSVVNLTLHSIVTLQLNALLKNNNEEIEASTSSIITTFLTWIMVKLLL
jgi:hypothetical protein